jgi:hypothetical protein
MSAIRDAVGAFNASVAALPRHGAAADVLREIRSDVSAVKGMARFDHSAGMPWHADRPAVAVYDRIAQDERLPEDIRKGANRASAAVRDIVLAHKEAPLFGPFRASYADAAGPTAHLPSTKRSFDSWADQGVSETHNRFYDAVDGRAFARAIGTYNRQEDAFGALG